MSDKDISPGPYPAEVVRFWQQKKLKPTYSFEEIWKEEHEFAFGVAKVMRADVLAVLHSELQRSITHGIPFEQWSRQIAPKLEAVGWWHPHDVVDPATGKIAHVDPPRRLQTIFDTNMRTAHAAGQWDRMLRNARYRPYALYLHGNSERPRPVHLAWHGTLLPLSDPFWSYATPINGWGCRCTLRSVSEREARTMEDEGIPAADAKNILDGDGNPTGHLEDKRVAVRRTAPEVPTFTYVNKQTGVVRVGRVGIDPGFEYTPLIQREKWLDAASAE
jgi:SPP1 gp7 family putative phage head morphogenesis protein